MLEYRLKNYRPYGVWRDIWERDKYRFYEMEDIYDSYYDRSYYYGDKYRYYSGHGPWCYPSNDSFWRSRGWTYRPSDWIDRIYRI